MPTKIVLVEFGQEVEFLTEHHPQIFEGDVKVIALLPEARVLLKKKNIPFETSAAYFSKSSNEECLKCVDHIIQRINETLKIRDSFGLKHAYKTSVTFYLRFYLSYIVSTLEVLRNAVEPQSATQLHVCTYPQNDHSGCWLSAKERILGDIALAFTGRMEVCRYSLNLSEPSTSDRLKKLIKKAVCTVLFPLELMRLERFKKQPIVFYSLKYYFDRIARNFKNNDLYNVVPSAKCYTKLVDNSVGVDLNNVHLSDVVGGTDKTFCDSWRKALEDLKTIHTKHQLFSFRGFDFSSLVFQKWVQGYGPEFKKLNRQIRPLKKFYEKLKPAVVLSHAARDFSYALGELAELTDIPSILISHGSHVPPNNSFDRMEWYDHGKGLIHTDYKYHLLQSPWAVEHVRSMGYQGNYYAIDPLIFPEVDRSGKEALQLEMFPQSKGKRIFVHAGTPKPRGSNRLYVYETLDEYISNISDLVEAARGIPEIFLIIRFRPYPYLTTEQLKALLPKGDHYVIATEGPFADFLKIADVLVSFSSTTIEEALINRIPVLEYDPSDRYMHIPGVRWQDKAFAHADSVYYIGDRKSLSSGLKWILDNHLNATIIGNLFERHVFKPGEAVSVHEFVRLVLNGNLPKPLDLKHKKHLDGVEIF